MKDIKTCVLRTDRKGNFKVFNLGTKDTNTIIRIGLPSRASIELWRDYIKGDNIQSGLHINIDLGHNPGDDIYAATIALPRSKYEESIFFSEDFLSLARSFENSFQISNFLKADIEYGISTRVLGDEWLDQVFINLDKPFQRRKTNIEFSVVQTQYLENFDGNLEKLTGPAMTLVVSLKLFGQKPHYFMFVEWDNDNLWRYSKNFFYNRTLFPGGA
ncbi:hypothetical protein KKD04_01125 [Patescibacteria group bacterium]|nr:hypothetical protein [Patescibacteria group bacterium]